MAENESALKEIFKPEYYGKFKCDGQKCNAKCCRCGWRIYIDRKTYKKYSHLKPKNVAKEITRNLAKCEDTDGYAIKLDEDKSCPFLTEDNWCSIQRKYGEDFLSETCTTYPRYVWDFENFMECSLTLTCPVVAETVLLSKEPLKFERSVLSEKDLKSLKQVKVNVKKLPPDLYGKCISIQETAISVLQERNLTIDQRLMVLGLYIDRLEDLWANISLFDDIDKINVIYQKPDFRREQAAQFSALISFDATEHIKMMFGLLETLYGEIKWQFAEDRKFLEAVIDMYKLKNTEGQVETRELVKIYSSKNLEREKFIRQFSTIFENFLVNEFFLNTYPFKIEDTSPTYNYGIFVAIYKMLEFFTFSTYLQNNSTEEDLLNQIMWYAGRIDHSPEYNKKIQDYVSDKSDIVEIMQILQV